MKRLILGAILTGVMGLAKPAAADTILFDFNGTDPGGTLSISQFDWWPGNSILQEDEGVILYQANLNVSPSQTFCNTSTDFDCFTAVASFTVEPTAIPGQFTITGGTFDIYANATYCNDLVGGGCFTSGELVLSSDVTTPFGTTSFTADLDADLELLDQFNGDSHGGVQTVVGSGGFANILTTVTYANPDYFLDVMSGATISTTISAGSNNLPYTQVDPTRLFFDGSAGVPRVGAVNGFGSYIMAEADASTTVNLVNSQVPEPATLTLLGLGLLGTAAARRRRMKNAKK